MKNTVIWYSSSDCEDPSRYELRLQGPYDVTRPIEQIDIARFAADDFHNAHDGWEARWPRDITLYATEDGPPLASFEVEREHEPHFYARRKEVAA